jgi:hypothetical protein
MDHGISSLVPLAVWGLFLVVAVRRWIKRAARPTAKPSYARSAAAPPQPPLVLPARRRLAPAAPVRPVPSQTFPAAVRPASTPTMAETLPAEAAAAFPALDLSLPDTPVAVAARVPRRGARGNAGGPAFGSRAWLTNAIIANEILGTPVGLRPGATVGIPHAF